jgi:hypothetical protein
MRLVPPVPRLLSCILGAAPLTCASGWCALRSRKAEEGDRYELFNIHGKSPFLCAIY